MIILEEPYVSNLLIQTIKKNDIPVLANHKAIELNLTKHNKLFNSSEMISEYRNNQILYSNSENSIEWINNNLKNHQIVEHIDTFKNKFVMREKLKDIYPDYYFKEINIKDIESINFDDLKIPFVIKPSYGFLSFNVFSVSNRNEWDNAVNLIQKNIREYKSVFPENVISSEKFIIEEYIDGTEFAADAYFDDKGEPVILNILEHKFTSKEDMTDRLYITSKNIIRENYNEVYDLLKKLNESIKTKNFPVHIELRKNDSHLIPIEVNPLRFAGWCTTDIVWYAYGINPYEYFLSGKKPDWNKIFSTKNNNIFSIIVIDKLREYDDAEIIGFDYDKLVSKFEKVHELRKIDYQKYPIFGFLITETSENNFEELDNILHNDLQEFIIKK
jgi:hypothetical protein